MVQKLLNRVRMSVASAPGTGIITVNTAAVGFQSLVAAGLNDGDTTSYVIEDGSPIGSAWEIGLGTWSNSGTFTRTSILQSTAGGSTPISASANAILSATFLPATDVTLENLGDVSITSLSANQSIKWNGDSWVNYTPTVVTALAGLTTDVSITSPANKDVLTYDSGSSKWTNQPSQNIRTTPTVVQYGTLSQQTTGAASITLGAAPTAGNLLVFMGNGGNSSSSGLLPGIALPNFDYTNIEDSSSSPTAFECSWGYRVVRSGDGATWSIGTVGNSGATMNGVLVEVAGVDLSALADIFQKRGQGTIGASWTDTALSLTNALQLLFIGGGGGTLTVSTPSSCTYGPSSINGGVIAFNYTTAAANHFEMTATISTGVAAYDMMITLPGVF